MGNLKTLPYEQLVWFNNCLSDKSINLFWSRQLYETRFWQVSCRYLRVVFVIHNWLRGNGYKHQGRFNSDGFVRDLRALHAFRHWSSLGNKATMCKTSKQDVEIKCLMITDTIICTTNYSTISNISVCNSKSNAFYKSDFQKLGEWHFFLPGESSVSQCGSRRTSAWWKVIFNIEQDWETRMSWRLLEGCLEFPCIFHHGDEILIAVDRGADSTVVVNKLFQRDLWSRRKHRYHMTNV